MLHGGPLRDIHRSKYRSFSQQQVKYLAILKEQGFEPKVIYDIGAGMLHWVREAKRFWYEASYVLFEAFDDASFLYRDYLHHIGLIGNKSLMYQQIYDCDKRSLDDVVLDYPFPNPDFVKIDAGSDCVHIISGGLKTLSNAKYLLIELVEDGSSANVCSFMFDHGWELYHSITYSKTSSIDYIFRRAR